MGPKVERAGGGGGGEEPAAVIHGVETDGGGSGGENFDRLAFDNHLAALVDVLGAGESRGEGEG